MTGMGSGEMKDNPMTLSVCMIVKDEEPVLERCLKNASQFADEIIVVDTGSSDSTKEIARRYTRSVYDYEWQDDFAAARNYSYSKSSCDYIMWLDADDDMEPCDIRKLIELKNNIPPGTDVVFLTYTGDPDDEDLLSDSYLIRDRIIKRDLHPVWEYPIHEAIGIKEDWKRLYLPDIRIIHRKIKTNEEKRNIRIFEKKLAEGYEPDNFNRAYYCRELASCGRYEEAIEEFQKLWEMERKSDIDYGLLFYIESMKHLKRYEELWDRLEQYTERFGSNDMVFCTMGDICRRSGRYTEAISWYEKARSVHTDPCDLEIHFPCYHDFLPCLGMAKAYIKMNDKDNAEKTILESERIHPGYMELKLLKLWLGAVPEPV